MSTKQYTLKQLIVTHLGRLWYMEGAFAHVYERIPEFDLYPRDYLEFAEKEFASQGDDHLVNGIGHLKRAIDSQLDILLEVIGVGRLFQKRNLKFDKKLEFLKEAGIISPRTFSRLNSIRNETEHSYKVPEPSQFELYLDLASVFIYSLEYITIVINQNQRMVFRPFKDKEGNTIEEWAFATNEYLAVSYNYRVPEVNFDWMLDGNEGSLKTDTTDIHDFAYCFKTYLLLAQREAFISDHYIVSRL